MVNRFLIVFKLSQIVQSRMLNTQLVNLYLKQIRQIFTQKQILICFNTSCINVTSLLLVCNSFNSFKYGHLFFSNTLSTKYKISMYNLPLLIVTNTKCNHITILTEEIG